MSILTRFRGQLTCYQCHRNFYPASRTCPNCGASRRESNGQVALRRLRRALCGAIVGAGIGALCMLLMGQFFPDLSEIEFLDLPLPQNEIGLAAIGLCLGGLFGAVFYTLIELGRDQ